MLALCSPCARATPFACCVQGIAPEVFERLPEFEFHHTHIILTPHSPLTSLEHPLALPTVLRQLTTLHACSNAAVTPSVQLSHWHWTDTLARNATALLPELSHFHFTVVEGTLTDELLGALAQFQPERLSLSLLNVWKISGQHADKTWGFESLFVRCNVDVTDLVRPPRPLRPCVVRCAEVLFAASVLKVRARYTHKYTKPGSVHTCLAVHIRFVPCPMSQSCIL